MKEATQYEIIDFLEENILCKFGIPETITTDQATNFNRIEVQDYLSKIDINLLNSTPYYAQANDMLNQQIKLSKEEY
ncbi:MAG: hypothetical protein CBCREVIR_3645 [Candidatus Burkholderia crenata]|nr:MAG: hypothetical protein CBCREVIR_3645 [Candidatus Burkholderia crenata]